MKLLFVLSVDPWTRSAATIDHYAAAGRAAGHEVAVFGAPNSELPGVTFTTDITGVDLAVFVLQVVADIPEMPALARLIDRIPRERRVALDLWGRANDTIRVEHDFNHLEKVDGHQGWEWQEAIRSISDRILQPTLAPAKAGVGPFLFHGFAPAAVAGGERTAKAAAAAWRDAGPGERPYGAAYVGSNWHRWAGVRAFLEQYDKVRAKLGPACLAGWDWGKRPQWAIDNGIAGIDTDPELLARLGVEVRDGMRYDEIVPLLGKARFAPILHRPLFRQLGFVTGRTFETFHADAVPVILLPREQVEAIYGPAALALTPGEDLAGYLADQLAHPERTWEAVLETRAYLARTHSYAVRLAELEALARGRA